MNNFDLNVNKALVKKVIEEVFNQKNLTDKVDTYYSPNYIQNNRKAPKGREGMKQFFSEMFIAFPDWTAEITHIMAEEDQVNVYVTWTGTHSNTFQGIPASHKKVTLYTADRFRIENGQIAEHWDAVDNLDMMLEIGAFKLQ